MGVTIEMVAMRNLVKSLVAVSVFLCSASVIDTHLNRVLAKSLTIEEVAKDRIKTIYPEFIGIVNSGADENKMLAFAEKNMDTNAISKRFCGTKNDKLVKSIIKFLIWRLKTEAIQSVKDYALDDNVKAVSKGKIVEVKCKLLKKASDPVNMTVTFSKNAEELGKIREIKVLEIPLIEGAKTPMKKFFEENGIKIDAITNPAERAEKCCLALEAFINGHKKKTK